MVKRTGLAAVLVAGLLGAYPIISFAQDPYDTGIPNVTPSEIAFATRLQQAVKENDRNWIADHVNYPLGYRLNSKRLHIKTRAALLKAYDKLFVYDVTYAIEKTDVQNLFKTEEGVMMGDGELWFRDARKKDEANEHLLIVWINTADQGL
jgi:hypothetical protein